MTTGSQHVSPDIPRPEPATESARAPADRASGVRLWFGVTAIAILVVFTWRAPLMYFSGDDMMNMYKAWRTPWSGLLTSLIAFWTPAYRPLGTLVYRVSYGIFGFHPAALYWFCWTLLIANGALLYWFVARALLVSGGRQTAFHPLIATVIATVQGMYQDLYYSAGTIYDRLSVLFALAALHVWLTRSRGRTGVVAAIWIALLTVAGCDGKENAVAIPVLLLACEVFIVRTREPLARRLRSLAPIAISGTIAAVFILTRVKGTPDLNANPAYQPHASVSALLTNLDTYLGFVSYGLLHGRNTVLLIVIGMLAATALIRSRLMLFGLVWLAAGILPVALITARPGYALYLPMMGFGIWLADLLYRAVRAMRVSPKRLPAYALAITAAICLFDAAHWPPAWTPRQTPEWFTTRTFAARYPKLAPGSRLLFLNDPYPRLAFDLAFNLMLYYGDPSLRINRLLSGPPDQRPKEGWSTRDYDHVFVFAPGAPSSLFGPDEWSPGFYVEYAPEWMDSRPAYASEPGTGQ